MMEEQNKLQIFDLAEKTAKVNFLTGQTAQNIIEIGRTMLEVKENIPYGEFNNWLENHVHYSRRTAYNFMKVANEFEDVHSVAHLGIKKLLALTGIEAENREKIINNNDLEKMTVKQVEEVVEEGKQIKKVNDFMDKLSQEITGIAVDYSGIKFFSIDPITGKKTPLTDEQIEEEKKRIDYLYSEFVNIYRLLHYEALDELRTVINNEKKFAYNIAVIDTIKILSSSILGVLINF